MSKEEGSGSTPGADSSSSNQKLELNSDQVVALEENAVMTNLLYQCASIGSGPGPTSSISADQGQEESSASQHPLSAQDKQFLEGAIKSCTRKFTNPIQQLVSSIDELWNNWNGGVPTDEQLEALSKLEELTEDMNRGDDFLRANGLQLCFKLLNVTNDSFRKTACNLIANTSLNNPKFHQNPLSHGIILQLFALYNDTNTKWNIKLKYLHAVSCIFAGNEIGVRNFLSDPTLGQALLYKHYFSFLNENEDMEYKLQQRLGLILDKVYTYIDDTRILNPKETEAFTNDLLNKWFEMDGALIWTNLNVLLSIISGKNSAISRIIIQKQEKRILDILKQMKESKDFEDNVELLRTFEQKFDDIKNKKILSICL